MNTNEWQHTHSTAPAATLAATTPTSPAFANANANASPTAAAAASTPQAQRPVAPPPTHIPGRNTSTPQLQQLTPPIVHVAAGGPASSPTLLADELDSIAVSSPPSPSSRAGQAPSMGSSPQTSGGGGGGMAASGYQRFAGAAAAPGTVASSTASTPHRAASDASFVQRGPSGASPQPTVPIVGAPANLLMSSSLLALPSLDPNLLRHIQNNSNNTTTVTTANGSFVIPNNMLGTFANLNNDSLASLRGTGPRGGGGGGGYPALNGSIAAPAAMAEDDDFVLQVPAAAVAGNATAVSRTGSVAANNNTNNVRSSMFASGGSGVLPFGGSLRSSIAGTSPSTSVAEGRAASGGGAAPRASQAASPRGSISRHSASASSVSREARQAFGRSKGGLSASFRGGGGGSFASRGDASKLNASVGGGRRSLNSTARGGGGGSSIAAVTIRSPSSSDGEGAASKRSTDLRSERTSRIFAAATERRHSASATGWFEDLGSDDEQSASNFNANALYDAFQGKDLTLRRRLRFILDGNPHHKDAVKSFLINGIIFLAICVSIIIYCISSFPSYYNETNIPMQAIEGVCVAIFILEAVGRVVSCSHFRNLLTFFFVVDVTAIIGYFLDLALRFAVSGGGGAGLSVVRIVRLIRVFRVIKVSRHSASLQVILLVIKSSMASLLALVIPIVLVAIIAACLLYYVETSATSYTWDVGAREWLYRELGSKTQVKANIQSIPDTLWFAFATVTTVGFGDTTVVTIAARTLAALLQLTGVLMVNFPNIILGGNVQVAYKEFQRQRAVKRLGKRFRRVYMCVCFISAMREQVANRRVIAANEEWRTNAEDETLQSEAINPNDPDAAAPVTVVEDGVEGNGGLQGAAGPNGRLYARVDGRQVSRARRRPQTNYLVLPTEASNYQKEGVDPIVGASVRWWRYRDVTAVCLLQRLLEHCSGVGTTEELHQTFIDNGDGGVALKDVDVACLYLLAAGYLQLFAFKRFGLNMLCALTPAAVTELMVNPEEGQVDCIRSAEMARVLWRRTTGTTANFSLNLLSGTYPMWAATERLADNERFTPYSDLKVLYDEDGNAKPMPTSFFSQSMVMGGMGMGMGGLDRTASFRLAANAKAREASRRAQEEHDRRLRDEAKATLRDVIAQRQDYITSLQEKVDNMAAMAKASGNFVSVVSALNKAARRRSSVPPPMPMPTPQSLVGIASPSPSSPLREVVPAGSPPPTCVSPVASAPAGYPIDSAFPEAPSPSGPR